MSQSPTVWPPLASTPPEPAPAPATAPDETPEPDETPVPEGAAPPLLVLALADLQADMAERLAVQSLTEKQQVGVLDALTAACDAVVAASFP